MTEYVNHVTGEVHQLTDLAGLAGALLAEQGLAARMSVRIDRLLDEVRELRESGLQPESIEFQDDDDDWAPWNWRRMPAATARTALTALTEWVVWLRSRYPIAQQLPSCWHVHPELVEELSALHWVWRAAFHGDDPRPTAPADFHAHYLPGVLERVRLWGIHCGELHEPRADSVYASAEAPACMSASLGIDDASAVRPTGSSESEG